MEKLEGILKGIQSDLVWIKEEIKVFRTVAEKTTEHEVKLDNLENIPETVSELKSTVSIYRNLIIAIFLGLFAMATWILRVQILK